MQHAVIRGSDPVRRVKSMTEKLETAGLWSARNEQLGGVGGERLHPAWSGKLG